MHGCPRDTAGTELPLFLTLSPGPYHLGRRQGTPIADLNSILPDILRELRNVGQRIVIISNHKTNEKSMA